MTCPDLGLWRAWLDGQAEHEPPLADHLTTCAACQAGVADLRRDAGLAAAAVAALAPPAALSPASVALARERLVAARADRDIAPNPDLEVSPVPLTASPARWRVAAAGLAAALALTLVVATPAGQAAASRFLAQFRSERFAVVLVDSGQTLNPLSQLEKLGDVRDQQKERARRGVIVGSVDEASRRVGFPLKQLDPGALPPDLRGAPRVRVLPAAEFRFKLEREKVRRYLQEVGHPEVQMPARLDGATLVVGLPAAALLEYDSGSGRGQSLIIGQSGQLTAGVEGAATLDELRDFVLGLPGLPPGAVAQMRQLSDWRTAMPLPVPVDKLNWRETTVGGAPAVILSDRTGVGSGVLWQRDGRIYGAAGTLPPDDLLRVASRLG
jgi:hypothetical protein